MNTRCGRFQCLGLAVVLALGAGLAWAVVGAIAISTMDTLFAPPSTHWGTDHFEILRDGTPIIRSQEYVDNVNSLTFRTLDGKPYNGPVLRRESTNDLAGPYSSRERFQKIAWRERVVPVGRTSNGVLWYFVHDGLLDGHGYLVGYDNQTRLRIGYIGRDGFSPDEPPTDEQFPVDGRRVSSHTWFFSRSMRTELGLVEGYPPQGGTYAGSIYLMVDDGLVLVDLDNRTAEVVLKDADFISASNLNGRIAVRTPDHIRILQPDGKEIRSYSLPSQMNREGPVRLWELPNDELLLRSDSSAKNLLWFDAAGALVRQEHLALRTWSQPKWISQTTENFIGAVVAVPSPGALVAGIGFDTWKRNGRLERLQAIWPEWWPGLLGAAVISVVLAVFCFRRQRKYGLPWTGVWAGFVLLFGLPAYLGYRAHHTWPARLPCPDCGQLVPRDRPTCFICGKHFPAPALKGIEVFG